MSDRSAREIEDFVLGEFDKNHDQTLSYQSGRLVQEPLASGNFLREQQLNIENDAKYNLDSRVSKTKGVLRSKEGKVFWPSLKVGNSRGAEGSLPHACRCITPTHDLLSLVTDNTDLGPGDCQMANNCFKQCNIDLESNRCRTSNVTGASRGATDEIKICHLSPDKITSADSKLVFLPNDKDRENDLLCYVSPDNSNFEVDKMFSHCDPMFEQWSNTDAISWFSSSSNDIFGPEDTFTLGLESSSSDFSAFNDASAYCANIRSLTESGTPGADNHEQSRHIYQSKDYQSFKLVTGTEQAYDGNGVHAAKSALTQVDNVHSLDEYELEPLQINMQMQHLDSQYSSQVEGKGLEPCSSQLLPKQNRFMASDSSSYMHSFSPYNQVEDELLCQNLFLQTTSSTVSESDHNPFTSHEVSDHGIINNSYCMDKFSDSLSKTQVVKLKEVVQTPIIKSSELANSVWNQHDNLEEETGSDRGKIWIDHHTADLDSSWEKSSPIPSVFTDDISVNAISFHQFQDVICQLDLRAKLCIRDSLYRLAGSAEPSDSFAIASNENVHDTESSRNFAEYMNMEKETNPIDQSMALLLAINPQRLKPDLMMMMPCHSSLK